MSTIKCALCGAEWFKYADTETHDPGNDCPLAGLIIEKGHSEWINAAIEAAKVDNRKSSECVHYVHDTLFGGGGPCISTTTGHHYAECPCAAWEKE